MPIEHEDERQTLDAKRRRRGAADREWSSPGFVDS